MWNKLTVAQYQAVYAIITDQSFENEVDRQIHLLSCLFGQSVEHYEAMLFTALQKEIERTRFLNTKSIPSVKPPRFIKINGRVYQPVYDFRYLAAGQFIDAVTCVKDITEQIPNMHRMLAAICRPITRGVLGNKIGKYGDVPFTQVAEDMKEVPFLQAYAIAVFFWNVWETFLQGMPDFLEKREKKKQKGRREAIQAQDSQSAGDG
jgi:hypothetical protein